MKKYNVAVVGAGVVGIEMLRVLKQRNFPIGELRVFARSAREVDIDRERYSIRPISPEGFDGIDIALFAGTEGEKGAAVTFAAEAVKRKAVVIDNGADFRMDPKVPLVVPEVNAKDVEPIRNWFVKKHRPEGRGLASDRQNHRGIIANPNCSTIQMVVALNPIHKKVGVKRIIVTTLQASSGAGKGAVEQLKEENSLIAQGGFGNVRVSAVNKSMPQQLAYNVFPHIGSFIEGDYSAGARTGYSAVAGYTNEEWKLVKETHKIMHAPKIKISATTVRVPVRTGHSESIYIETCRPISADQARAILSQAPGVILMDEPKNNLYPMPKDVEGRDETFVGRIRKDAFVKNGLWLWVVADNLRKGASTNAVQIAECVISGSK
ncbi:MAG: aspartate-semialdehyde dehydrogenase [Candidatus Omnitrophica bacterium]|jgi:aspartate-semialdehyde dehydrogenase|nr:aspartate-semialdehyde dehydrogenase [Candidatus Omnitrophota bacterium]MDD5518086.1 aspartate-semialdehyde dehydrogenase [Candidatus Omnitrophota bacterium]